MDHVHSLLEETTSEVKMLQLDLKAETSTAYVAFRDCMACLGSLPVRSKQNILMKMTWLGEVPAAKKHPKSRRWARQDRGRQSYLSTI